MHNGLDTYSKLNTLVLASSESQWIQYVFHLRGQKVNMPPCEITGNDYYVVLVASPLVNIKREYVHVY